MFRENDKDRRSVLCRRCKEIDFGALVYYNKRPRTTRHPRSPISLNTLDIVCSQSSACEFCGLIASRLDEWDWDDDPDLQGFRYDPSSARCRLTSEHFIGSQYTDDGNIGAPRQETCRMRVRIKLPFGIADRVVVQLQACSAPIPRLENFCRDPSNDMAAGNLLSGRLLGNGKCDVRLFKH